jgi:molybdate transport system substrate-binding protein
VALLGVNVILMAGCQSAKPSSQSVVVLAAASTREAIQEITGLFTRDTGITVHISADDSSKLAEQIVNGSPADLFLSAHEKWASYVKDKGKARSSCRLFGNSLVLVVPKGNPAAVTRPDDLAKAAVKRIALAGPTVPAGMYGRQALQKLNVWESLNAARKIVPADNVRTALAFIERGECEAGLVYATDVRVSDKVEKVYTFDPATHDPIVYPLVLLQTDNTAAAKLYDYLQSPPAQAAFRQHGFVCFNSP